MTRKSMRGFTLVELNIALVFVALLLVAVATTTIYAGKIYQKGVVLKEMNQLGREVMSGLRTDIATANTERVEFGQAAGSGRLCLGGVSYVYNTADALNAGGSLVHNGMEPVRLARVEDKESSWCEKNSAGTAFVKNNITTEATTELLHSDNTSLAIYSLVLTPMLQTELDTGSQGLFRLSVRLGTSDPGTVADGKCKPPTDNSADFEYCSVRDFDTIIRTREN